jgi:two-component sensor histidine kinase
MRARLGFPSSRVSCYCLGVSALSNDQKQRFGPLEQPDREQSAALAESQAALEESQSVLARTSAELREVKLILAETRHRVRNSFATLNALLQLKRKFVEERAVRDVFDDVTARVAAIASAHYLLLSDTTVTTLDASFIRETCRNLRSSFSLDAVHLVVEVDHGVSVPADYVVPLSLIMSELVSNTFKHAYTATDSPLLTVKLSATGEKWCRLIIEDNGSGIGRAIEPARGQGGWIIEGFAKQIGGSVRYERPPAGGTRAVVSFPYAEVSTAPGGG